MVNPYEARKSPPGEEERWTVRRLLALVCWCYPLILIASFYGNWALAGIILGHPPQPWLDDPQSVNFVVSLSHHGCTLWLVMFPFFAIYGAIGELFPKTDFPPRPAWRLARLLMFGFIWFVCFGFLRWDPNGVVQWYIN